ncbi:MAG: ECF-type sigma factor [Hydrogenophaga sp.]|uniref:ECF-type sigma factor n=2 Tax=Pseudomonadota TaxID=1224 RepID=UPI004035E507
MARIERIKQRLDNWALWKERDGRGGLGFYTSSSFLRIAVDNGSGGDPLLSTVDEVEALKTDEAVTSLLGSKPQLHRTIELIYLADLGIRRTAEVMCKAESTVKANLEKADFEIQTFLRRKEEERERAAAASK